MKTTLDIPDDLFRQSKARAALRGQSLRSFVSEALEAYLGRASAGASEPAWRALVGRATRDQTVEVDREIDAEFGRIDSELWD